MEARAAVIVAYGKVNRMTLAQQFASFIKNVGKGFVNDFGDDPPSLIGQSHLMLPWE